MSYLSNGEEVHLEGAHPSHVGQLRVVLHGHEQQVDPVEELQVLEDDRMRDSKRAKLHCQVGTEQVELHLEMQLINLVIWS